MTNRAVMQQALECIERLNMRGFILADFEDEVESAITALREALAQPEQEQMRMPKVGDKVICLEDESLGKVVSLTAGGSPDITFDDGSRGTYLLSEFAELFGYVAPPAAQQEPTQWRDMVVVSLVREGINKHKARELADHFAAQPEQEPTCPKCKADVLYECVACSNNNYPPRPEQEPVISAWSLREVYFDEDGEPSMHRSPPAAQRSWQGLTDEEVQFYIKKHSKLVNAGYDKVTDTNLVAKTFDSTGFYKEVSTVLKERNT